MADIKIKPLGDRVLIEAVEAVEETMGGILIPDSAKEKPQEARVVALGTGKVDEDGKKIEFEVKVDGKEYKLVSASDILAIVG